MIEALIAGATLGLATGTACLASCGPVYGAYLLSEKRKGLQSLWVLLLLNAGRFFAYAAFGAIMGLFGGTLPASIRVPVAYTGYILFSVYMLLSVVRVRKTCSGCQTGKFLKITGNPFILGALTGLSICPAFLIALTSAFESSGPLSGMMYFIGFFGGTTVYMLPFAVVGLLTTKDWLTKAARVIAVVVAIYFGAIGIKGLVQWLTSPRDSIAVQSHDHDHSDTGESGIYSVSDSDSLYVIQFLGDPEDHGSEFAEQMSAEGLPPVAMLLSDSTSWESSLTHIPELSPVIISYWADPRSGIEPRPWQEEVRTALSDAGMRVFAVQYEPFCADRVVSVESFLASYSFRCDPDSGFTFLMLNTLACAPADCATCPIEH